MSDLLAASTEILRIWGRGDPTWLTPADLAALQRLAAAVKGHVEPMEVELVFDYRAKFIAAQKDGEVIHIGRLRRRADGYQALRLFIVSEAPAPQPEEER